MGFTSPTNLENKPLSSESRLRRILSVGDPFFERELTVEASRFTLRVFAQPVDPVTLREFPLGTPNVISRSIFFSHRNQKIDLPRQRSICVRGKIR